MNNNNFNIQYIYSYGHIVRCYEFVFERNKITQYIKNNFDGKNCSLHDSCPALLAHINRKRENVDNNNNNNNNIIMMIFQLIY